MTRTAKKREVHVFDFDGVIVDQYGMIKKLKDLFPTFKEEDLTTYDIGESLLTHGYVSNSNEFDGQYFFETYEQEIFGEVNLLKGFKEYYNYLESINAEIHILTARNCNTLPMIRKLLDENNIHIENITCVGEARLKQQYLAKLKPDYFYEDYDKTLLNAVRSGYAKNGILLDATYNRNLNLSELPIQRIYAWSDLLKKIA